MPGRILMFIAAWLASAILASAFAAPRPVVDGYQANPLPVVQIQMVETKSGPNGIGDPQRCLTIRKCQFQRGGSFRGCISTYSCRVCRLVESRCEIGGQSQNCREMRCTWG